MHEYRSRLFLGAPLCLSACFGRVDYGVEPVGLSPVESQGGPASPTEAPASIGGGAGRGEDVFRGSGGTLRSWGAGGQIRQEEPPRHDASLCEEDCCPQELTQVTFSVVSGSLDGDADKPYLSGDGVSLVFSSTATNLIAGEFGQQKEVFSYSLSKGAFERLSVPSTGGIGNGDSEANGVSDDGRWVLLTSWASNFASEDKNEMRDVFLWDRDTKELRLVSASLSGASGNGTSLGRDISPDGRFVVYSSSASDLTEDDDNGGWDVFVWDQATGLTERISMGPGDQQTNAVAGNHAHISDDGRFVSFHSRSDRLTEGDENGTFDIFLTDRARGSTTRISQSTSGETTDGNAFVLGMSGDGRYLSSYATASNLVSLDENGVADVFLLDRTERSTVRVNLGPMEQEAELGSSTAVLSPDGRFVTFASAASSLVGANARSEGDSFLFDASTGTLSLLSQSNTGERGNGDSQEAHLSRSGRCFVFASRATNLTSQSTDDTMRDLYVGRLP